nr:sortase [Corynebacterium aurimucosum]
MAVVLVGIIAALKLNQEPDTPAPQPTEVVTEPAAVIEPSPAVEMYIPTIDVRADFEEGSCRVKDNKINPDSMNKACTYTAEDKPYSLPGTDSPDIVVIAGHTGAGIPAVFNNLYDGRADEHKAAVGDKLYLRTQNSGEQWLVYTATDLHDPSKEGLEQDESIWGADAKPGRLLTISCIQPANPLAAAVRNAVVGWQFEGVTTAPETAPQN